VLSGEPQRITRTGPPRGLLIPGVAIACVAAVIIFFVARPSQEAGQGAHADSGPHVAMPAPPAPVTSPPVVSPPVAPPPVAPPLPTTRPSDPSAPAVKPSIVDVGIRVSPETARVSIDGTDVGGGSFTRQYAIDDVIHSIRVVAPGYVTKSVTVPFTANITLDLSLERALQASPSRPVAKVTPPVRTPPVRTADPRPVEPAHPPDPATVRPPVDPTTTVIPKPAQPTDVDPAGGSKPRRPIDPNNPYGGRE
jgi:hypothetical protein